MKCHSRLTLIPLACSLGLACLHAQQRQVETAAPFSLPASALLKAAAEALAPAGTDIVVLLEDNRVELEADGRRTETWYLLYKAVTVKGAQDWGMVEADWAPWRQQRPQLRARVVSTDGAIHELDPATVADVPVDDHDETLTDRRSVRAPLPAVAEGTVVEQEVVMRDTAPVLPVGGFGTLVFGRPEPVLHSRLTVSAPLAAGLHYKTQLLPDLKPARNEADGRVTVTFDQGALPARDDLPPLLPPDQPRRPMVVYTTVPGWNDVARAYGEIVDRQIADARLKPVVHELAGKTADRDETIAAILHGLNKQVRYTGLEFGESAIVPHTPAETLKHGYGDCKDKAALLVAALRAAGITAHVALLYASDGADIDSGYPGVSQFNHAIVYVPGATPLWLDPTDPELRPGVLPENDQGRWALIADATTKELVRTPEATSADNRIVETREFQLAETGPAHVIETTESWGTPEESFRSSFGDGVSKSAKETLQSYVEWTYASKEPPVITQTTGEDFTHPYQLRLEVAKAARGTTEERDAAVAIRTAGLTSRLPGWFSEEDKKDAAKGEAEKPAAKRTEDFYIAEPLTMEWRYRIVPPPGFRLRELPPAENRQMGPATLTASYSIQPDGAVTATLRFEIPKRRFSAEQGLALRDAVRKLNGEKMKMIDFDQTAFALLSEGKVKDAIAELAALQKLHPKEAMHRSQLARVLLEAGAGEMARAEARSATDLEPASAKAWHTLGWVLRHDLIGRQDAKGADHAGAAAAFRKAKELDPDDYSNRADLAITLEFNAKGVRYGKDAPLDKAIAEYQEMKDKLAGIRLADNLPIALMWAGRFADLRDYLQAADESELHRVLKVIADAGLLGSAKAVENARKSGEGAQRDQAILSAGQTLIRLRRYDLAADLMAEGAKAAPQPAAVLSFVDGLRRTHKVEDIVFAGDKPTDAIGRLMQVLAEDVDTPAAIKQLLSDLWLREEVKQEDLAPFSTALRAATAGADLPMDVAMDIGVGLVKYTAEGSDASGWQVRIQAPGSEAQTAFVIREGGAYRILSMGGDYSGIGRLVLELAAQDKLADARNWLDRVREEVVPAGGDDPLAGRDFPRLWTRGSDADQGKIRAAAAALLAEAKSGAAEAVPILRKYREGLPDGAERNVVDSMIASALSNLYKDAEFLEAIRALSARVTGSVSTAALYVWALERTRGWKEFDEVAVPRLQHFGEDAVPTRVLARAYAIRCDYEKADEMYRKLVNSGKAEAQDYNAIAWNSLFEGSMGKDAFDAVDRGNMLTKQSFGPILHTAAAMYAEAGKTKEARATILRRMEIEGHDEPDDDEWYVFGRILEQYGLNDAAQSAYLKMKKPEHEWMEPLSSYALAQRRLAALKASGAVHPN